MSPQTPQPESANTSAYIFKKPESLAKTPAEQRRFEELMKFAERMARDAHIHHLEVAIDPRLILSSSGIKDQKDAFAILIGPNELRKALASDEAMKEFESRMGHEMTHIRNGDTVSPPGSRAIPDKAESRYKEILADLGGNGPLGSHNPGAGIRSEEKDIRELIPRYLRQHPGIAMDPAHLSAKEKQALVDWGAQDDPYHPSISDRIATLKDEEKWMREYEIAFQKNTGHGVKSISERETEEKWVIGQVLKDIKDHKLPSVTYTDDTPATKPAGHTLARGGMSASGQRALDHVKAALIQVRDAAVDLPRAPEAKLSQPTGPQKA